MTTLTRIAAVLASAFCLLGGTWILAHVDLGAKDDALSAGIGFYFIGKALFVGPLLALGTAGGAGKRGGGDAGR